MLLGLVVHLAGTALLVAARLERAHLPPRLDRAGAGTMALGAAVLLHAHGGIEWDVASILLGIIAVSLLLSVVVGNLRR